MCRYFEQFGDILEAVVITDKNTSRSKGYGFVTFTYPDSVMMACQDPSQVIDGRRANCSSCSALFPLRVLRCWLFPGEHVPYELLRSWRGSPAAAIVIHASLPSSSSSSDMGLPSYYSYYAQYSQSSQAQGRFGLHYHPQMLQYPYLPQQFGPAGSGVILSLSAASVAAPTPGVSVTPGPLMPSSPPTSPRMPCGLNR